MSIRLYAASHQAIIVHTLAFSLVGLVFGYALGEYFERNSGRVISMFGAALCGAIGYSMGTEKALRIRFEAQIALCQAEIERSVRQLSR